jgi:hypothetical protein
MASQAMPEAVSLEPEDLDALEDVFATVELPIGLLNMDYAGNNIRTIRRAREVLGDWQIVRNGAEPKYSKQRSELNLLGFANGKNLTELGRAARAAGSEAEVARLWCEWIQATANQDLALFNPRLTIAKRVFRQFWRLAEEVRNFFLANSVAPSDEVKPLLQIIELVCNASDVAHELSIEDMRSLVPMLQDPRRLPTFVGDAVRDYRENKGLRSWTSHDRRTVPLAWREVDDR